jgi:hypothetical protein
MSIFGSAHLVTLSGQDLDSETQTQENISQLEPVLMYLLIKEKVHISSVNFCESFLFLNEL